MKQIFAYICLLFLFASCGQENNKNNIDASKVKSITIINKVDCSWHNLEGESLIITERKDIDKIINQLTYSELNSGNINMKINNGFFDISFYEGNKEHLYTINYTVYNGVVLWYDGNLYKNDKLEVLICNMFTKD